MGDDSDAQRKKEEMDKRKADVRKRLEESGKAGKKAKKGFLTPERKKKLRKLLMVKAAEELKNQQLIKEQERNKILAERTIPCPSVDDINDTGKLLNIYEELYDVIRRLEENKYDLNQVVLKNQTEINEMTIAVNDLRGKYVKPVLKKVSKYDNKFKKMAEEGGDAAPKKADFRGGLKTVKKENPLDLIKNKEKKDEKPDWKAQMKEEKKEEAPKEEALKEEGEVVEAAPEEDAKPEETTEEPEEEEGEEDEEEEE